MGITKTQPITGRLHRPPHHPCREKSHLSVVVHLDLSVFIQFQLEEAGAAAWGLLCLRGERSDSWVKEKPGLQQERAQTGQVQGTEPALCTQAVFSCCIPVKWN